MTISRWVPGALGLAVLILAGCGAAAITPPSRAPVTSAHPPVCTPAPGMQLAARTSVGTGATATAWAATLLKAMDDPVTAADVSSMLAWFSAEDDRKPAGQDTYGAGEDNPLNLTADSGDRCERVIHARVVPRRGCPKAGRPGHVRGRRGQSAKFDGGLG